MNKLNNETELLLFALKERYESMHKIRERAQSVGFWSLGLFLSASVWFFKNGFAFNGSQKIFIIIGLSLGFYVLKDVYLRDLLKGFKNQQIIAVKIEDKLGYYSILKEKGSIKSIYPINWKKSGTEEGNGHYFDSTFSLLYVGFIFLLLSIFLSGSFCIL